MSVPPSGTVIAEEVRSLQRWTKHRRCVLQGVPLIALGSKIIEWVLDLRDHTSYNKSIAPRRKRNMPMEWGALNTEFHRILVGLLRNSYFGANFTDLSLESSTAQPFANEPSPFADLVDQHDAIIDAIKA